MLGWNWACFGVIHPHRQSPRRGVHVCGAPGLRSNRRNIQTEQVPLPHSLSVTHISVIAHTWAWQTHAETSKHTQWSQLSLRCRSRVSPGLLTTAGRRPVPLLSREITALPFFTVCLWLPACTGWLSFKPTEAAWLHALPARALLFIHAREGLRSVLNWMLGLVPQRYGWIVTAS